MQVLTRPGPATGWLTRAVMTSALLLAVAGCSESRYVHAVFFYCKADITEAQMRAQINDAYDLLGDIPSVRRIDSGLRDVDADRPVNVTDYDIGLTVYFEDRAGHDIYQDHPRHLEYVNRHKANWDSVRVFDFVAE